MTAAQGSGLELGLVRLPGRMRRALGRFHTITGLAEAPGLPAPSASTSASPLATTAAYSRLVDPLIASTFRRLGDRSQSLACDRRAGGRYQCHPDGEPAVLMARGMMIHTTRALPTRVL